MANDPQYVRLHNRLVRGMHLDLNSGFGISGLDIVPFPDDDEPEQQAHVRYGLRTGVYEEASSDEVKAFEGRENDYLEATGVKVNDVSVDGTFQEGQVQALATKDRRHYEGSRGLGSSSTASYEAEQARRDELLKEQGGKTSDKAKSGGKGGSGGSSGSGGASGTSGAPAPAGGAPAPAAGASGGSGS